VIKNVCFDLDGVLFAPTCFKDFKAKIAVLTAYPEKIDEVFHGPKMDDFKRGLVSEADFWQYADAELVLTLGMQGYFDLLVSCYVLQPEVVELVQELIAKGKQISICTNNFETRIRALQAATGFLDMIDIPIISHTIGSLKPEKRIYQELIDKSGCAPEEIFYSDDNEDKLQGAKDLGIHCEVAHNLPELFEMIRAL
jgi:HAD superfamily hydrolase (TIGR01509 family)